MPRIREAGLSEAQLPMYVTRKIVKGRAYLYFRWRDVYQRLPDDSTSEAFRKKYAKSLASISSDIERPVIAGSVRALMRDYKSSPEYLGLAPTTQAQYTRVMDILQPIGDFQADNVRRQHVIQLRNKMPSATRTQDLFVAVVSRMFSVGMDLGYSDRNPAARIERLNDAESYLPWPTAARETFEASTMPKWMRHAYMIGLWTGQREGDVLRLARARYDGAGFDIRQGRPEAKRGKGRNGPVVELYVPAVKVLREYLAAQTFPGLLFVTDDNGKPVQPTDFRHQLRAHLNSLGLNDLHYHGLRHTTATALAEKGATTKEIMSITGHLTEQMVGRYTKRSDQRRLAASAMRKLEENG
jgi:integrase